LFRFGTQKFLLPTDMGRKSPWLAPRAMIVGSAEG
jgi:hypothetical protein